MTPLPVSASFSKAQRDRSLKKGKKKKKEHRKRDRVGDMVAAGREGGCWMRLGREC
jgi:hypothetical protein